MITQSNLESSIEKAASAIYQRIEGELSSNIKNELDEWCELHGLKRLSNPLQTVAKQAAFNLLLKATLYERHHQRGTLPQLPSTPRKAFQHAEKTTGDSAFNEYVLDDIAWLVDGEELADLFRARHHLVMSGKPAEEVGKLFESLTPQESRRKLGQFRTPKKIADLMATWV